MSINKYRRDYGNISQLRDHEVSVMLESSSFREKCVQPRYLLLNSYRDPVAIAELLVEANTDITEELLYDIIINIIRRNKIIKDMRKELLDLLILYSKKESEHTYLDYYTKLAEKFTIIMLSLLEDLKSVGYTTDDDYCFHKLQSINTIVLRLRHHER
jgi:hypothetical protein